MTDRCLFAILAPPGSLRTSIESALGDVACYLMPTASPGLVAVACSGRYASRPEGHASAARGVLTLLAPHLLHVSTTAPSIHDSIARPDHVRR